MSAHRIFGVGNAGVNFLDQLLMSAPSFNGLVAMNSDAEALMASVVTTKITLPHEQEPEAGLEEVKKNIETELETASTVILCGGLGGATASSLLPLLAEKSKAAKKLTIACVSKPFLFEGKRVQTMAAESLQALEKICDGIFLLDNNALCANKSSGAALGESFTASDEAMKVAIPALLAMLASKGPVRINRSDLLAALSQSGAKTHFGYGEATGANRLHEAIEQAFKNPLLDRGRSLGKAKAIFVLLRGPKNISFAEAQAAMQEVEKVAGDQHDIQLSVQAEESEETPLQIFILATSGGVEKTSPEKTELPKVAKIEPPKNEASTNEQPVNHSVEQSIKPIPEVLAESISISERVPTKIVEEQPELSFDHESLDPPAKKEFDTNATSEIATKKAASWEAITQANKPKPKSKQTQGALNLTTAQRGRFDKSEPTIVEGEDLDTPTYLRLGLKLGG